MGGGTFLGAVGVIGVSCGVFYFLLQQQRAKPACVWVFANGDKTGSKTCLPVGSTSVPFIPQYAIVPKGLAFAMQLGNADSSVTSVAVGSGSNAELQKVVGAGQTIKSIAVTVSG